MPWQFFGVVALVVVTIVIVFDIVDGALARETGQVTRHGKVLDPLVDKFITYSTLILFWSAITKTGFVILFALDITSTFLRGSQVQGANRFGKNKALAQNISKFFFATAVLTATPWLNHVGNFLIWLAVVLASFSVGTRVLPANVQDSIRVAIPQILTLGNLAAGIGAVWCALNNNIGTGVLLIFIAMACDLLDGAIARKLGVGSNFGQYFDTVADLVSFGAGPAFLVAAVDDFSTLSVALGAVYFTATCIRLVDYGRARNRTPAGFSGGFPVRPGPGWWCLRCYLTNRRSLCWCWSSPLC
jgi:phosphatidylglycerophosphate synthase